jgi:hypothetical protein
MERIAHETKYTGDVSARTRVARIFLEISNEFCLTRARLCARTGSPGGLLFGAQPVQFTQTRALTDERRQFLLRKRDCIYAEATIGITSC